jgi:poly-beta-hydroxyalkanoate depolymerase
MNNEPVAWMDYLEHSDVYDLNVSGRGIPLYTHPAKTLTDEEIKEAKREALKEYYSVFSYQDEFELSWIDELFARAILRKAQEK